MRITIETDTQSGVVAPTISTSGQLQGDSSTFQQVNAGPCPSASGLADSGVMGLSGAVHAAGSVNAGAAFESRDSAVDTTAINAGSAYGLSTHNGY